MKTILKLAILAAAINGISFISVTAQAKTHKISAIPTGMQTIKPIKAHAKQGYMYSGWQLTKANHHLTNYKHTTFYVNQQIHVIKPNGNHAIYYWLTNKKGVHGYVWRGYVKLNGKIKIAKSSTQSTNKPVDQPTTSTNKPTNSEPEQNTFSESEYRTDFVNDLNKERTNRGLSPVTENPEFDTIAHTRANQAKDDFTHYDANGKLIAQTLFEQAGIGNKLQGEDLGQTIWTFTDNDGIDNDGATSTKDVADDSVYQYIYNDAASNWGHKKILLNPNSTTIGVGAVSNPNNHTIYNANELGIN